MDVLKTATGKEFDCDYFNPAGVHKQMNIRVLNVPIATVATIFSDPIETMQMWCDGMYAENFTQLVAIVLEGDAIRVVLEKN